MFQKSVHHFSFPTTYYHRIINSRGRNRPAKSHQWLGLLSLSKPHPCILHSSQQQRQNLIIVNPAYRTIGQTAKANEHYPSMSAVQPLLSDDLNSWIAQDGERGDRNFGST